MNALKPRPPFRALVMSEESRLGRESIETAYALKQIVTAGVRVFFYLEDRERTLDSPTDKIMLSLTAFADDWACYRATCFAFHGNGAATMYHALMAGERGQITEFDVVNAADWSAGRDKSAFRTIRVQPHARAR